MTKAPKAAGDETAEERDAFLSRVRRELLRLGVSTGDSIACAVSGGADSVALLRALCLLADELCVRITACHMEHGIRGEESLGDQAFVRELCSELAIPLLEERTDIPLLAEQWGMGLETAARQARHAFFHRVMQECGADLLALGHHANDQAETVLMRLGRGARGSVGMAETSPIGEKGRIIRPLLDIQRDEIEAWLSENGWPFRQDATNFIPDNPRNAIRLHVLPEMLKWYPGAVAAIGRAAGYMRSDDAYLQAQADEWLAQAGGAPKPPWPPEPLQRRAMAAYVAACGAADVLDSGLLERLMELAVHGRTGQRVGKSGWLWEREKSGAILRVTDVIWQGEVLLPIPGEAVTPLGRFTAQVLQEWSGPLPDGISSQLFDADLLPPLTIRTRQPGDTLRLLNAGGSKKLKEILIDKGIPRAKRDSQLLLANDGRVYWMPGLPPEHEARVADNTRRFALITFKEELT